MAEVTWQARRISDGVLVDVTGDTDGEPAGAPTPNALESGGGAVEQTVLSSTVALSAAQIRALPTTEITLVSAPGAGRIILMFGAFLRIDTSVDGYANFDIATSIYISFAGEGAGPAQALLVNPQVDSLLTAFDNQAALLSSFTTVVAQDGNYIRAPISSVPTITNKALVLGADNSNLGGTNFTGGDPGTGSCTVIYTVVDL